jgi:hypothetical protein
MQTGCTAKEVASCCSCWQAPTVTTLWHSGYTEPTRAVVFNVLTVTLRDKCVRHALHHKIATLNVRLAVPPNLPPCTSNAYPKAISASLFLKLFIVQTQSYPSIFELCFKTFVMSTWCCTAVHRKQCAASIVYKQLARALQYNSTVKLLSLHSGPSCLLVSIF